MNIDSYDLILGTPFLVQHQLVLRFNPSQVGIGSIPCLSMRGPQSKTVASQSTVLYTEQLDILREELREYAKGICKNAVDTNESNKSYDTFD